MKTKRNAAAAAAGRSRQGQPSKHPSEPPRVQGRPAAAAGAAAAAAAAAAEGDGDGDGGGGGAAPAPAPEAQPTQDEAAGGGAGTTRKQGGDAAPILRGPYHTRLINATSTIYAEIWNTKRYDRQLQLALRTTLTQIGVVGLIAYVAYRETTIPSFVGPLAEPQRRGLRDAVVRFVMDEVRRRLQLLDGSLDSQRAEALIRFKVDAVDGLDGGATGVAGDLGVAVIIIPDKRYQSPRAASPGETPTVNFCAMVYDTKGRWRDPDMRNPEAEETRFVETHCRSTLKMLFDVIRGRVRRMAPFPKEISERYWEDARHFLLADEKDRPASRKVLEPPWDKPRPVTTATLSFDLRKSTFCMEQADTPMRFAKWVDQLVQILTLVGHKHGGAFDKFTGDGALVHFLKTECLEVYGKPPAEAALACAGDMQRAVEHHLTHLREFIRLDSDLLGAGIGIDIASAFWSIDHRDNPIVVGRGVVGACRLCASPNATAGRVLLTNMAYQELRHNSKEGLERIEFTSKEFRKDMHINVWQIINPPGKLGETSSTETITKICQRVYDGYPPDATDSDL